MFRKIITLLFLIPITACSFVTKENVSTKTPVNKEAYYNYVLGYEAELSGKLDEALKLYSSVLELDPESLYVKIQMAYVHLRKGDIQKAVSLAEDVLKAKPGYIPGLILLGEIYNSQKNTDSAIKAFRKVLDKIGRAHV